MAVAAHHDQVGPEVLCALRQCLADTRLERDQIGLFALHAMTLQSPGDIARPRQQVFSRILRDANDPYCLAPFENGQRIKDRARRLSLAAPRHQHPSPDA